MAGVVLAGSAQAQSASGTLSAYRTGYSGTGLSGLESPVNLSLISAGSQYGLSDGVNQAGAVGTVFSGQTATNPTSSGQGSGGADPSYSGVGQLAANNERAPLAVVESANQSAAQARSATTMTPYRQTSASASAANALSAQTPTSDIELNGKLNLDGGQ